MKNLHKSLLESAKTREPAILLTNTGISSQIVNRLAIRSVCSPSKVLVLQQLVYSGGVKFPHPVLTHLDNETGLKGQVGAVALIQRSSGARIGEVLRLKVSDIIPLDTLLLRALKRSRSRSVRVPELSHQLNMFSIKNDHPLFTISYTHVYRAYIQVGIVIKRNGMLRNSVTHTYRHNYIRSVQKTSQSVLTTAEVVGHKSKTSTLGYLNKGNKNG